MVSAAGTPNESRSGSPGPDTRPSIRKAVSFCSEDEGLEEVFEADDWDRSPIPMTPRLSYQDILELKQLQLNLPRAPPSPNYRQPFTTSAPRSTYTSSSPSTSIQPFPISRFATARSLTPSKWKNRDDSRMNVDPEILPYLEAVPIQLLPLLDSPASPESETPHNECASSSSQATPSYPTPIAQSPPQCSSPPAILPPISIQSPSPKSPDISSPSVDSPATTPTSSPRRTANFTFVPLLPVQEQSIPAPQPAVQKPPEPKRRFNMTFVPLMPLPQPLSPSASTSSLVPPEEPEKQPDMGEAANEATPESYPDTQLEGQVEPDISYSSSFFRAPSPTSTPALSSASDTDTESEAPSTSDPPSPSEPGITDMASSSYFHSTLPSEENSDHEPVNPYFPIVESESPRRSCLPTNPNIGALRTTARPGQTPPLSMTQSSCDSGSVPTPSVTNPPDVTLSTLVNKVTLQAIPSPCLAPPSPFSLYPPSDTMSVIEEQRFTRTTMSNGQYGQSRTVMSKRAFTACRTRSALSLSSIPIPPSLDLSLEVELEPSFSRRKGVDDGVLS
ncbi:unnamed protein product [Somion occarium]